MPCFSLMPVPCVSKVSLGRGAIDSERGCAQFYRLQTELRLPGKTSSRTPIPLSRGFPSALPRWRHPSPASQHPITY
ncbi:hypothetical protein CCMA1212_001228 [Trichoderma ghanense]|uniref:Uncharacterized protein n=1 Tax=Trichoderma ghanense TaxID=65468 RepID=A0ABY2HKE2_9HYPO